MLLSLPPRDARVIRHGVEIGGESDEMLMVAVEGGSKWARRREEVELDDRDEGKEGKNE